MEKVKLLCAFVEEELSWIVQFFHDVLNKEVTASSGKIGRIFGAIAAATGDLTKSPVHQFDHGCFLNHSASWFVLLSFSVFSGTISAATQRNSRAQVDLHPFFQQSRQSTLQTFHLSTVWKNLSSEKYNSWTHPMATTSPQKNGKQISQLPGPYLCFHHGPLGSRRGQRWSCSVLCRIWRHQTSSSPSERDATRKSARPLLGDTQEVNKKMWKIHGFPVCS